MTRPLRLEFAGSFWHITVRGNERREIFRDVNDCARLLDLLAEAVRRFDWVPYAYALMPNHYHLALELTRPTLSRGMQWLNGRYAQMFNTRYGRVGHLFQGRFHSFLIEKESYFLEVLRYVVLNPVRAKIVARPEHSQWTSYRATAGLSATPQWLAVDRVLEVFHPDLDIARCRYREFVEDGIGRERRPWDEVIGQIYLGTDEWAKRVQAAIAGAPRSDEFPHAQKKILNAAMSTVIRVVASVFQHSDKHIRHSRGGAARMLAAWLARYESSLDLRAIAAGLRISSAGHISELVTECERELGRDEQLQAIAERCIELLHQA